MDQGHDVILHARRDTTSRTTSPFEQVQGMVLGDLAVLAAVRRIEGGANVFGPWTQ